jgi:hypothetical protein
MNPATLSTISALIATVITLSCTHTADQPRQTSRSLILNVSYLSGGMWPTSTGISFYADNRVRYVAAAGVAPRWSTLSISEAQSLRELMNSNVFHDFMGTLPAYGEQLACCDSTQLAVEVQSPSGNPDELASQPVVPLCGDWHPRAVTLLVRFSNSIAADHFRSIVVPYRPCEP